MTTSPPERLRAVMPAVVSALHDLARELDLRNEELLAVLAFLTEVGQADEFILLSDVLGLSRLVDDQTHAAELGTPSNVQGPFYRPGAPWIENPGTLASEVTAGTRLVVSGRVSDAVTGAPVVGAVLDVWHADETGTYSNEDSSLDAWNLRGRQRTDAAGRYRIETVRPLHYTVKDTGPVGRLLSVLGRHPWRPAHVHFLATADGYHRLVTQVYIAGGPYLADDTISGVKADLVSPVADGVMSFDIVLVPDGAGATRE